MTKLSDASARIAAGLELAEEAIKAVGAGVHKAADSLAGKLHDFRDAAGDTSDGGRHADQQ